MLGIKLRDRYEIVAELGRGGMGVVYRARDPLLERDVAIKVVPSSALGQDGQERLRREAKVIARLDHPGVVQVFDVGDHESATFYVMPLVEGTTLRELMRSGPPGRATLLAVAAEVAAALAYTHERGIVHRDVKPENVMIAEGGRVRVMDFGLARASRADRITQTGMVVGTLAYLSPEQVRGEEASGRSDVWAVGAMIYEGLVGRPPFVGDAAATLYRIVHEPLVPPSRLAAMEPDLDALVVRCLAKSPELRPSASELHADLVALRPGERPTLVMAAALPETLPSVRGAAGDIERPKLAPQAAERLAALDPPLKALLADASVLGDVFDVDDLRALPTDPDGGEIDEALDRLIAEGWLEEEPGAGDRLRFVPREARDTLHTGLPRRRRRMLHVRCAERLEARLDAGTPVVQDAILHHYLQARVPERVAALAIAAARRALAAFALDDATTSAALAVEHAAISGDGALLGQSRLLVARALKLRGDLAGALRSATQAADDLERSAVSPLEALVLGAESAWQVRELDATTTLLERGLAAARRDGDSSSLAQLLRLAGTMAGLQGDHARADTLLEEAARHTTSHPIPAGRPRGSGAPLHVPLGQQLLDLDPAQAHSVHECEVLLNVFETLTRAGEGARIKPWLAREFWMEEGGRRFRCTLRDGIRFHDGSPLDAAAVRRSFLRAMAVTSDRSGVFRHVKGSRDAASGEDAVGITVCSPRELVIDLDRPLAIFPALLTHVNAAIVAGSGDAGVGHARLCGTGPFRVSSFRTGMLELDAHQDYWREGLPVASRLAFSFRVPVEEQVEGFLSGRHTILSSLPANVLEELLQRPEVLGCYREVPAYLQTFFLAFRCHEGPLRQAELRRKLRSIADVPSCVARVGRVGVPARRLNPPSFLGYPPPRAIAQDGVASAGRVALDAPIRLCGSPVRRREFAPLVSELTASWSRAGVEMTDLDDDDWQSIVDRGDAEVAFTGWHADYPDPDAFAHGCLHGEAGAVGRFCGSPELDRLIEQGRAELDPLRRRAIYLEIEDVIDREALLIPLFHLQGYRLVRPEVSGFAFNSVFPKVRYEELERRSA